MRKGGVGMDHPDSRHIESMSKDQIDASDSGDPDPPHNLRDSGIS